MQEAAWRAIAQLIRFDGRSAKNVAAASKEATGKSLNGRALHSGKASFAVLLVMKSLSGS